MADLDALTPRQREIYNFIRSKIQGRGYGPTVREIGLHFQIKSPNGVMCHLKALQKKGLIHREPNMSRAIQLLEDPVNAQHMGLKLVGRIAAGQPIEAVEQHEELTFTDWTEPGDKFALRVTGDSMIEEHIADGDFVIIRRRSRPATARSSPCATRTARRRSSDSTAIATGSASSRPTRR